MSIIHQLRQIAIQHPNSIALSYGPQEMTFHELQQKLDALAQALQQQQIGPGKRVAIALPRSFEMIIGILGVMASGAAWVPLDPANPAPRLKLILEDAQPALLLTDEAGMQPANETGIHTFLPSEWPQAGTATTLNDTDLAYIIYTSGSTGKPKGVAVSHAALENYVSWAMQELSFTGGGVPLLTSISFDHAITNIFAPLLKKEKIILCPPVEGGRNLAAAILPDRNFSFIPYSYIKITPSLFSFLDKEQRGLLGCSTQLLIFGGEKLSPQLISDARLYNPGLKVMNHYGPTEATVGCAVYRIPAAFEDSIVSIGTTITNMMASIRKTDLSIALPGETGELFISGPGLANGYWRQPALTAKAFIELPDENKQMRRWYRTGDLARLRIDGLLELLGRADEQIKILGNRIEPAEIVALLNSFPGVKQATVFALENETNTELVASLSFYGEAPPTENIRKYLLAALPPSMVPARYLLVNELPVAASGKADVKQLISMLPVTQQNKTVAELVQGKFREILCQDEISLQDDYFMMGGDSLGTVEIATWAASHYRIPLDIACMFSYPTVASLSEHIEELMLSTH